MNFPQEHYNHPDSNTEWWYFAGMGELDGVGPLSYHVSFFRKFAGVLKKQIYFVHQGLNINGEFEFQETKNEDVFNKNHHTYCDNHRLHFYIGNWDLEAFGDRYTTTVPGIDSSYKTSFTHIARKRPAIHGPGYYSITDMDVSGAVKGDKFKGRGWFDHEFFDFSSLQLMLIKYKWFALQLDSGIEIMLYVWPKKPTKSFGTIVFPEGETQSIKPGEYCVSPIESGWSFELPKYGMNFKLKENKMANINPELGPAYKEGTFDIVSRMKIGHGYFEMTGGQDALQNPPNA